MPAGADASIDDTSIAVPDAILAIRTFPRRFREALARVPPDRIDERPDRQMPSVIEDAAGAGAVLARLAAALPRVLDEPGTQVEGVDAAPSGTSRSGRAGPDAVLAGIADACDALATRADATPWEAWDRTFTAGGVTRPASWIVQHAAGEGSRRLRAIERVARRVGGEQD